MDKKPLIGISICAVVLLVLGSLSNVVGYQSVKSTVNDSPLFQTRTQRATNQQQNILTSQYLGKGNQWQFPIRDNRTILIQKVIDRIRTMDDRTFKRFVNDFIYLLNNNVRFNNIDIKQIVIDLYRLRVSSEKIQIFGDDSLPDETSDTIICFFDTLTFILMIIICVPIAIIFMIGMILKGTLPTSIRECSWRIAYCR